MSEKVTLSMNELKRLYVVQQIADQQMTGSQAAELLGLSLRQVRRLIHQSREHGASGLAHGNRGRAPNNRIADTVRAKIQELIVDQYRDYNDSHLTEELREKHALELSRSSVRRIRRQAGQKSPRKRRSPKHRSRRARKEQAGMLLQADGSRHAWLEGRGALLTLIAYIDDATNEVPWAGFREEEDAAGYFLGLQAICLGWGIPGAVYADQHTIFQSPSKATIEQELAGQPPRSQFERLLDELGIELIAAHSPQAKGRIERLWETFQDRLVKALREAGAATREEADQVLVDFLPAFNARFRVQPAQSASAYVPWPQTYRPEDFFCFKHTRTVSNDNTFSFAGHRLQIPPGPRRRSYAKAKVEVRQHLDGRLEVRYQEERLAIFEPAEQRPVRVQQFVPAPGQTATEQPSEPAETKKPAKVRQPYRPAEDHPWRKPLVAKPKGKNE